MKNNSWRRNCIITILGFILFFAASSQTLDLSLFQKEKITNHDDWLLANNAARAMLFLDNNGTLVLSKDIVSRTFFVKSRVAAICLENHQSGESFLIAVWPEVKIKINGFELNEDMDSVFELYFSKSHTFNSQLQI